ncbi:MAG TPA: L-threonylcarbamoyladenylate synthase [Gemmataceae bacterium]|nr:L-threonylcarbamoyladenylate synthase [Gemmataceae bacterium]
MDETITLVLRVAPDEPSPGPIATAAAALRRGWLVAFPTETVYGLGANALDPAAVGTIFRAKGRPPTNPVIVHVADEGMLTLVAADWPPAAAALARAFWPGPLTLVVPKAAAVPDVVTGGGPTVAVRRPTHPVAQALIRAAGVPVAAPSANRSAELSPTRAEHVLAGLSGRVDVILDGGPTPAGIESTVVDVTTSPPTVLRPGPISVEQLEAVVGPVAQRTKGVESGPSPSPGMMARHYAPRTPVELVAGRDRLVGLASRGRVGVLALGPAAGVPGEVVALPADPAGYAARLYAALHDLDALNLDRVLIEEPPATPEWLAVRDRLTRAATLE